MRHFLKWLSQWTIKPPLYFLFVMKSKQVGYGDKIKIILAILYAIIPVDFIPEALPVAGILDDSLSISWALYTIYHNITPEIKAEVDMHVNKMLGIKPETELPQNVIKDI